MTDTVIEVVKILLLTFFIGYGFSSLFLPKKLRKDSFFIIFWIGIIFTIILSVALTTARIPISQGKYLILFFSFLFFIFSIIKKKSLAIFSKETFIFSILVLICILVTSTKSSLIQNSYINESKYLINHSFTEDITRLPYRPDLRVDSKFPIYGSMLGNPLFLGFISSTIGVDLVRTYDILKAILFSILFPLIYILIKNLLKQIDRNLSIIIYLIFISISVYLYMAGNDFFTQIIFLGIFTFILVIFQNYFSEWKNMTGFFNSYDLLIALGVSSINSIYPKGLIINCLLFLIYFFLKAFSKERTFVFWSLLKILLLAVIINPMTFGLAIKFGY